MQFNILGPMEVRSGGEPLDLGGPKQRAVLAVLVLSVGRVVSVDRIVDELWGDEPPARALGTLQAYVFNLRRVLEPGRAPRAPATVLASQPPGYVLQVADDAVDANRFQRSIAQAQALLDAGRPAEAHAELSSAMALWRGPPLADLAAESFTRDPIVRLTDLNEVAVETRLAADLALGRHATAAVELGDLVRRQPLRERPWELLMLALYRGGRQGDALRTFEQARRMLINELGVEPGPALVRLERQILNQDPSLDWQPPAPAAVTLDLPARKPEVASRREPFVGRQAEQAALRQLLEPDGPRYALIGGEAGAGKTRLAQQFADAAAETGRRVVVVRCSETPGTPAFWPWRQVLREYVKELPEADAERTIATARGHIARMSLDWIGSAGVEHPRADFPDAALFQLYDWFAAFVDRGPAVRPLAVVLDDLQWADTSTLRVLVYMVTDPRIHRLRLVATYRDTDAVLGSALHETLTVLAGESSVVHLSLSGLAGDDVRELIESATERRPDDEVVEAVRRRTGGNALFVTELTRLLAAEGRLSDAGAAAAPMRFPDQLQVVINRRLARLPAVARGMLTAASVIGEEFTIDVLAQALGTTIDELLDPLETTVLTRIVIEEARPGSYRFAHALIREALYDGLSRSRRARWHARIVEAMESIWADDPEPHAAALAFHASRGAEAGTAEQALRYGVLAAREAAARLAYDQAAACWQQALDGLELARPADRATRYELLIGLSRAKRAAGDVGGSQRAVREAIEIFIRMGEDERTARASVGLSHGAGSTWSWRPYGRVDRETIDVLERALVALGPQDSALRAELMGSLAVELYFEAHAGDRAAALSAEAVAMADRLGDPVLKATTLNMHYFANLGPNGPRQRLAIAEQLVLLPEAGAVPEIGLVGLILRMTSRLETADLAGADADLEAAAAAAERLREPAMGAQIQWFRATRALIAGHLDDAERLSEEALTLHRRTGLWGALECFSTQLFQVRREQGRIIELEPLLVDMAGTSGFTGFREAMALMYLDVGRVDDAVAALGDRRSFPSMPRDWSWLYLTCLQADVCADIGDDVARRRLSEDLSPFADQLAVIGTGVGCWGPVAFYVGRLQAALGHRVDAEQRFREALAMADRIGAVAWRE
ncbi:MAG TPA: BTAD domain-containing putative transcriptional regulator, partial [Ilumatobacter sp.]|nr:BTAD domain-containing putative transcriptional regulator [Ilumatobacter sp.]